MTENRSYRRSVLYFCDAFEIVCCEWTSESVSALHSHGWSQCAVLVQEGCFENRTEFGLKSELNLLEPGQIILTPTGAEHEIKCVTPHGKTLHVYAPKITAASDRVQFKSGGLEEIRKNTEINLTNTPTKWSELEKILSQVAENSVSTNSPYFMNQLFSGLFPESILADKLATQTRTTLATFEASPVFTAMEIEVIERLCELIGWKQPHQDGVAVPGGSAANFMAIHCARIRKKPDFRKVGLQGEAYKIFVSTQAHYSFKKACLALGFGLNALVEVAVDSAGKMSSADLQEKIERAIQSGAIPLIVCATAGTTVLGAFDPLDALTDVCEKFGIWLHVDGAWGGPVLFSNQARNLVKGVERADSMTFDAHKLFGAHLTSSFFLTKHRGLLQKANDVAGGDYIFHSQEIAQDRGRLSWQCGRGPDALAFWTLWKSIGSEGLGAFVDRQLELKVKVLDFVQTQPRLELINHPQYLNVCVRVLPSEGHDPDWSRKVREQLKRDNIAFVNFASNEQGTFLRLILAHPKLEIRHIKNILMEALNV